MAKIGTLTEGRKDTHIGLVLQERAASEGPRWTRTVEDHLARPQGKTKSSEPDDALTPVRSQSLNLISGNLRITNSIQNCLTRPAQS